MSFTPSPQKGSKKEKLIELTSANEGTSCAPEALKEASIDELSQRPQSGNLHFAGQNLGSINPENGIPTFSREGLEWIYLRCGEIGHLQRFSDTTDTSLSAVSLDRMDIPDMDFVYSYIKLYQRSALCYAFPVIDVLLFDETIRRAYQRPQPVQSAKVDSAHACIFAFVGLVSSFNLERSTLSTIDVLKYAAEAQRLLSKTWQHSATLDGLQAYVMLVSFSFVLINLLPVSDT